MVDGTVSEHAGAAEHLVDEDVVAVRVADRGRHAFVCWSKDRRYRYADGSSQVHGPGIVRDEGPTLLEHARQQPQIRSADQIDDARRTR